jgi:hypothetical protein
MFAAKAPVKPSGGVWRAATVAGGWRALCASSPMDQERNRGSALLDHNRAGTPQPDAGVPIRAPKNLWRPHLREFLEVK